MIYSISGELPGSCSSRWPGLPLEVEPAARDEPDPGEPGGLRAEAAGRPGAAASPLSVALFHEFLGRVAALQYSDNVTLDKKIDRLL